MTREELEELFKNYFFSPYYTSPQKLDFLQELLSSDVIRVKRYGKPAQIHLVPHATNLLHNCSSHVRNSKEGYCAAMLLWGEGLTLCSHFEIHPEVNYEPGRADLGLFDYADRLIIAAEVGDTPTRKMYECFFEPFLKELWHFPYDNDYYYVWKRGDNWQQWSEEYQQQKFERQRSIIPPFWELDDA